MPILKESAPALCSWRESSTGNRSQAVLGGYSCIDGTYLQTGAEINAALEIVCHAGVKRTGGISHDVNIVHPNTSDASRHRLDSDLRQKDDGIG